MFLHRLSFCISSTIFLNFYMHVYTYIRILYEHIYVFTYLPNPSSQTGYNTRSFFKLSRLSLNSFFSPEPVASPQKYLVCHSIYSWLGREQISSCLFLGYLPEEKRKQPSPGLNPSRQIHFQPKLYIITISFSRIQNPFAYNIFIVSIFPLYFPWVPLFSTLTATSDSFLTL